MLIQMIDAYETRHEFCVVTEFAQVELFEVLEDDKYLLEEQVQALARQLVKALYYFLTNLNYSSGYETLEHPYWGMIY